MTLNFKECKQFELDLNGIDEKNNHIKLVAFILLKFKDSNSLKKFLHY